MQVTASQMLRIAIIGGGPGGLTLARLLHLNGIEGTVFEADVSPEARGQGGSLDLHTESGLAALAAAGLMADFDSVARPEDQNVRLFDKHGDCLFEDTGSEHGGRPEIDRAQLRELLLRSLPEGTVRWASRLLDIVPLPDQTYEVHLETGPAGIFDLVIGADGLWSRTRPLVSAKKPDYSGVTAIELLLEDAERQHPALSHLVGSGKIFALGDGKALIAQRNSGGKIHVYVALHLPESGLPGLDLARPADARAHLAEQLAGWSPEWLAFIRASSDHMATRPVYAFPVGYCWDHRIGVTLIGDAAHVMSPFAGAGVNNAMLDALELTQALIGTPDWREGVRHYEAAMFHRVRESAAQSAQSMEQFLAADGLENALRIFTRQMTRVEKNPG